MNFKQRQLVEEYERKIKEFFPEVTIIERYETPDGAIVVRVATPFENAWEIIERMGKESVEILDNYGYLIFATPLENVTKEELTQMLKEVNVSH
jgi:hypothetical protein